MGHLLLLGIVLYVLVAAADWLVGDGLPYSLTLFVVAIVGVALRQRAIRARTERRKIELIERFGAESAERIMNNEVWEGQTEAMLVESLGRPSDVTERVTARSTRLTYKYDRVGKNRFGTKIFLVNGKVVGWEM